MLITNTQHCVPRLYFWNALQHFSEWINPLLGLFWIQMKTNNGINMFLHTCIPLLRRSQEILLQSQFVYYWASLLLKGETRADVSLCCCGFLISPLLLFSAADGKEKITFCWGQDASGSRFKLRGPLWTWLIWQHYFAYGTRSLIKYMRKNKAGFAEQLDTKILIRLGILRNSRLEPHCPLWQLTHGGTIHKWLEILWKICLHWDEEGVNIDMPEDLALLKLQRLLRCDERQSAGKGKNNCAIIKGNKCTQKLLRLVCLCSSFDWTHLRGQWQLIALENDGSCTRWKSILKIMSHWNSQVMSTAAKTRAARGEEHIPPAQLYCS